ncbi:hypothetical protein K7W42_10875 [Deinococcus sp. HMF7604]|uniref:hypothetical protein n=1 Tax=Deinococcus betulae TaxID=2873312 RepID=UPI001CC9DFEC|nr:hypothetical protein [Deinococcus betulae]MBZ9751368.1 hypothetical protein [Deinococcus betulae]
MMTDDGEIGLVYRADVDEQGWPEDPAADPRFLACSQEVKAQAFAALWEAVGQRLHLTFELLELHDVEVSDLGTVREEVAKASATADGDLKVYLAQLDDFLSAAEADGAAVTISL